MPATPDATPDAADDADAGAGVELLGRQFLLGGLIGHAEGVIAWSVLFGAWPDGEGVSGIYAYSLGSSPRTIAEDLRPDHLAFHPPSLFGYQFATNSGTVQRLWRMPSSGAQIEVLREGLRIWHLAATASSVFYTADDHIGRIAHDGSDESVIVADVEAGLIAADDSHVFWTLRKAEGIYALDQAAGEPKLLVPDVLTEHLELDGNHLYWATPSGASRISKRGTVVEAIPFAGACTDLAIDERFVYCVYDDRVLRAPKDGAATWSELARSPRSPIQHVAVDDNAVYFAVKGEPIPTQWVAADYVYALKKP